MYEYYLKIQFGKLSGPDALLGFRITRVCCTRSSVTSRKIGESSNGR